MARERIWADAEGRAVLDDLGCRDLVDLIACARGGEVVSTARSSLGVRLQGRYLLKVRRTVPQSRLRSLLHASPERRECRASLAARQRGIEVPLPLVLAERHRGPLREAAALLRPWLPGYRTAREVLAAGPEPLEEIVRALRDWHDRGFRHGACYAKNLLLSDTGAAPLPIGFGSARFRRPGARLDAARIGDLARLAIGIVEAGAAVDPLAFLETYGGPPDLRAAVVRRMDAITSRRARGRTRREASPVERAPLPPLAGRVRVRFLPLRAC